MRRTATLETTNVLHAAGVALGATVAWTVFTLTTGVPAGFLIVPIGVGLGWSVSRNTVERGIRGVGLAAACTVMVLVLARLGAAAFTGQGLMADMIRVDDEFHRTVVYADELRVWQKKGRLPPALEPWLDDTSQEPDESIAVGVTQWLEKAQKRFAQRTPEEQDELYAGYAQQLLEDGGTLERLGLFVGLSDLAWLVLALIGAFWFPFGQADTRKTHYMQNVPQERLTTFDDLDVGSL